MGSKIWVVVISSLLLAGCGTFSSDDAILRQKTTEAEKKPNSGYISNLLETKEQAKQNIQNSMDQENTRLNEALGEVEGDYAKKYSAVLVETNWGKIKIKLYNAEAPLTVNNFLQLADKRFYDETKFHRVIKGFMIQGGDPNSKDGDWSNDGQGGPGYQFADEINTRKLTRGSLAMANSGPDTNGSQFFIVTAESTPWLDGKHTNFGFVIEGQEVVEKISAVQTGEADRPLTEVVINGIELLE